MGSMPIAGVIWQHIHYIVGLQRLGTTFTTSRIRRGFLQPGDVRGQRRVRLCGPAFRSIGAGFELEPLEAFARVIFNGNPTAGLPLKKIVSFIAKRTRS